MEGLVKGQIKPVLTVTSIRPCRQRLLSKQYLSLWGEKRPLVLHLKVQSHCFGVMGVAAGIWLSFQPCCCCVHRISLFSPPFSSVNSLLLFIALYSTHYETLFPWQNHPSLSQPVHIRPHPNILAPSLKRTLLSLHHEVWLCVCLLLIMDDIGSCNDDKILVVAL